MLFHPRTLRIANVSSFGRSDPGRARAGLMLAFAALIGWAGAARAQISDNAVRIVVMNDQGSVYSDGAGRGSVVAAELAVEDVGGRVAGVPIQVSGADHQNKPDVGATIAKRMIDLDGADAFFDFSNSSVSATVQEITRQAGKIAVHVGTGNADLYNGNCSPTGALWLYDSAALAKGLAKALYDKDHQRWFMLVADYAFGTSMQVAMTAALKAEGGSVVGAVRHPLATSDFGSFILQVSSTDLQVLALLNAGGDTVNAIKQASEFGLLKPGLKLAVPIFNILDVKSIGPAIVRGTTFLNGYYVDLDDDTRAFARRFAARMNRPPTHVHAAVYSAVKHYLKAVAATRSDDGLTVMNAMKEMPVDDMTTRHALLRSDGRLMRDMLLMEAKGPDEVKGEWDVVAMKGVVRATDAIPPLEAGSCRFAKRS